MTSANDEECRRGGRREREDVVLAQERRLRELTELALSRLPAPEPQPSDEEVESVFRAVMVSYYG